MDSQLTGSNELLYVQTEKVSVTIKGKATHPNFQGIEHKNGDSSIKVHCVDDFQMTLRDGDVPRFSSRNGEISTGIYSIYPMFYEQQQYEIVIEAVDGHKVAFWHDMENGDIVVLKDGTKIEQISIETFMRKPRESMRVIAK